MLQGQMMDRPLMISDIITYAADIRGDQEIVSARVEGDRHRYTYADLAGRAAQLANALRALGIGMGDRVATLAWNGYRHLELYYGISGIGAVCHTINPRLFAEQIVYVVGHAADRVLFLDATFVPLVQKLRDQLPDDLRYVVLGDDTHGLEGALAYETLLSQQPNAIDWPSFDERSASGICYTSGTTGHPKGVLYTHRSTLLHSYGLLAVASEVGLTPTDTILPVVPLFHVNAWGLPYAMPLTGTRIVMPGPKLDGENLFRLMDEEKVTSAWGVPTVWLGLLGEMRKQGRKPAGFDHVVIGGSAAPEPMIREFEADFGVRVVHGWGMTEMSPVGTLTTMGPTLNAKPEPERRAFKSSQGRRVFGCELKIIDEAGNRLPHDGEAFGELLVRGHGVMDGYFANAEASAQVFDADGWLRTGDVAKIDGHGFLYIVDRTKDVIKSGGEWISSLDLESAALGHPAIAECAVIAAAHPRWGERPLLVARLAEGQTTTPEDVRAFLADKVAKWWLPDDVVFVDDLPHTATGKLSKLTLRERFKDYVLPTAVE